MEKTPDSLRDHALDHTSAKGRQEFRRAATPNLPAPGPHSPVSQAELAALEGAQQSKQPPATLEANLNLRRPAWAVGVDQLPAMRQAQTREERIDYIKDRFAKAKGVAKTQFRHATRDQNGDRDRSR